MRTNIRECVYVGHVHVYIYVFVYVYVCVYIYISLGTHIWLFIRLVLSPLPTCVAILSYVFGDPVLFVWLSVPICVLTSLRPYVCISKLAKHNPGEDG